MYQRPAFVEDDDERIETTLTEPGPGGLEVFGAAVRSGCMSRPAAHIPATTATADPRAIRRVNPGGRVASAEALGGRGDGAAAPGDAGSAI